MLDAAPDPFKAMVAVSKSREEYAFGKDSSSGALPMMISATWWTSTGASITTCSWRTPLRS